MSRSGYSRRSVLRLSALPLGLAAGPAFAQVQAAGTQATGPAVFENGVSVLSSGPAYGYVAGWTKLLTPHLLGALPHDVTATFDAMGGPDGVTVGNAFGARMDPDGSTLMVAPGAALLAWLEGDSRVKYAPDHWTPIVVGLTPAVLVGRHGVSLTPGRRRPLRIGATNPIGPELAALLALDLIGVPAVPVFGMGDATSLADGLRRRAIDLAFLSGPKIKQSLLTAAGAGATPLFSTGAQGCDGPGKRDPLLPNVPSFVEAAASLAIDAPQLPNFGGYDAAAAAAATCFAAVIPDLVRAETIATWRRGAQAGTDSLSVAAVSVPQGVRFLTGGCAAALFTQMAGGPSMMSALRATIMQRYGWHAS
ncbi:hypothetical protein ACELLULO517_08440 [Acidisoma cellulosilytica]|uniref:TAXI family TRAP transporter solute-binding subunit n=1 Tax=Acidisoma cellulosilyticum TaxID=2802395 RepID=A0A963Z1H1_9PROT|nr:hypothetical protein [Acidisoma cellulosilyticum]MCB8880257.1 hypothetical protein [Acidisoma cellulosilyticum]